MLNHRFFMGVRVGVLAGATTAGVLVGLGIRHGASVDPFLSAGRSFTTGVAGVFPPTAIAILVGVIIHFVWMVLWGVCFSFVATPLRGGALVMAAALFALFVGALFSTVVPGALGAATGASLSTPQTAFLLTLLAGTLIVGMRLARLPS